MGLPSKLKNMNLFLDGDSYLGTVAEVTVPKLTSKMEEWRGGGMLGPIMMDMGLEKQMVEFVMGGLVAGAIRQFGVTRHDAVQLRFAGAYQSDDDGRVQACEMTARGRYSEIDMGSTKPGDDTEHKAVLEASYVRISVDGEIWYEVDMLAGIFSVFGVDRYSEIRAAIGA